MQKLLRKLYLPFILIIFSFGVSKAQDSKSGNTQSVKITYSPQPDYTKEARKAAVEGRIQLRVVFLADGKIGEIKEVRTLNSDIMNKYGLTDKAIEAAKKIKFEPAKRDGKAIAVVKVVIYDFKVY